MLALATTHEGDVPIFLRPLDGNSPDKEHLSAAVKEVMTQLREHLPDEHEQQIAVFDSGGYSEANMKSYNDAKIWWISRVPETSTAAKTALEEVDEPWQALSDGSGEYVVRAMELPQGKERWLIVRTHAQMQASKEQMENKVKKTHQEWEKRLWHLSKQAFGCQTDAQNAWAKALKGHPSWLIATFTLKEQQQYQHRGRPKEEATPDQTIWYLVPKLEVDQHEVAVLVRKKAAFILPNPSSGAAPSSSAGTSPAWSRVFTILFFLSLNCGMWAYLNMPIIQKLDFRNLSPKSSYSHRFTSG
jgi:transposase